MPNMLLSRTVRLFLDSIGRREEYEYYLRRFQKHEGAFFAVICPDRETFDLSGDLLVFDLQFLAQLGLKFAVLLHDETAAAGKACFDGYPDAFTYAETPQPERITVLWRPGETLGGALAGVVGATTRRVHFIRVAGCFHDAAGAPLPVHYTERANAHVLRAVDKTLADLAASLLAGTPAAHLSVCTPLAMLEELFTVKGHGTLIRRGSRVLRFDRGEQVDFAALRVLCEDGFGRPLRADASFDATAHFYIEANYRGAALLERHPAGLYLAKFVVSRQARGEGLAQELWEEACAGRPALFWRSRRGNPFNAWYDKQAEGLQRGMLWNIYWRGIAPERISGILAYCDDRPADFEDPSA